MQAEIIKISSDRYRRLPPRIGHRMSCPLRICHIIRTLECLRSVVTVRGHIHRRHLVSVYLPMAESWHCRHPYMAYITRRLWERCTMRGEPDRRRCPPPPPLKHDEITRNENEPDASGKNESDATETNESDGKLENNESNVTENWRE